MLTAGGLIVRVSPLDGAVALGLIATIAGITLMSSRYVGRWWYVATAVWTTLQCSVLACAVAAVIALVTSITTELIWHVAQAAVGAVLCTFVFVRLRNNRDVNLIERFAQAILLKESLEKTFEPVLAIARPSVFVVLPALFTEGRYDLAERLGRANRVPHYESFSRQILAKALFELGKVDEAHELAKLASDKETPEMREGWRQLLARIQIARGEAAEVIKQPMTCPVDKPALQGGWLLVLADAYVVLGNLERARSLIDDAFELARTSGVEVGPLLDSVIAQKRPISELVAAKRERAVS